MNILNFIKTIRESFIGSEIVYTKGSCYNFFLIIKEVYPNAQCYYDENHVITKLGNKYYDITGEVKLGRHLPFYPTSEDAWINEPYNIFKQNARLV